MGRRRLTTIAATFGLLVGLCTSAIGAQAAPAAPDATFNNLLWSYTAMADRGGSACYGGTFDPATGTCTIYQGTTTQSNRNVAVCVQNNVPGGVEVCSVTQFNGSGNNYALIIQRYRQNGNTPQATQYATVDQENGSGSNFLGVFQQVSQFSGDPGAQTQKADQYAGVHFNPLIQNSASGSNYTLVAQNTYQVGTSETASTQNQDSNQIGSLDQTDNGAVVAGAVSKNFVTESQFQKLDGDGAQTQKVDPRCCTTQKNSPADRFNIAQFTNQVAGPTAFQQAVDVATCDSSGNCTTSSTSVQNGQSQSTNCSGMVCSRAISCTNATGEGGPQTQFCTPTPPSPPPTPCPPVCNPGYAPTASTRGFSVTQGPAFARAT